MPIFTTASHNFLEFPNFLEYSPEISTSSSSLAPPRRRRRMMTRFLFPSNVFKKKKKKKVSIENESHVENDWQTNNKNFRTVSSTVRRTVRQFYYPTRHAFVSLLVSLLLHTRDCFAGSRGKFSTIPPTFALTRPTCSTCFQSDTRASFFHSRPFQTRKIRCTLFRRFRLVYGYYRTCYEGEICE